MISLVEDDAAIRDSLALMLECEGLAVGVFASCEAFLAAGIAAETGCLILDLHLPGMSGLELLERLRAERATVPVILMSGAASDAARRRAAEAGVVAFLDKPFTGSKLVACIRRVLGQPPAPDPRA